MIKNRLEKNLKKIQPWASRNHIEAYRIYDRDIPEFPFIVDKYKDYCLIYDKSDAFIDKDKNHLPQLEEALRALKIFEENKLIIKKRERQEGTKQYNKLENLNNFIEVRETQALFKVNLTDYLDTGLFLDHRPLRQWVFKEAEDKDVLNLFCYTGAISVFAALGKARVTSVDMSQTYLNWAQDNFLLNNIDLGGHRFIHADVLEYLKSNSFGKKFDLIILDPPTFSNSKRMENDFEVEKDQDFLVNHCLQILKPNGKLYFSNNKRKFKLSDAIRQKYKVIDLSEKSIPQDFHDKKIHQCFQIQINKPL